MGTYTLKEYSNSILPERKRKLSKMKSVAQAAGFMTGELLKTVAHKSGESFAGIRGRPKGKNKYIVQSTVPGKPFKGGIFYQNLWQNRSPGPNQDIAVRMNWTKPKFRPVIYGDGSHTITGVPGFFDLAVMKTRKKFPKLIIKEIHKIMRS